jgi:uncharacterized protein
MSNRQKQRFDDVLLDAGCGRKVIDHCHAVTDLAVEYAGRNPLVDINLVTAGAMLHDIGRSATHSIGHAQQGADILRKMGCDEKIARIVECHTGAGLTPDECTLLGLLPRNCVPETAEEKIVCHADNCIEGKKRVSIEQSIAAAFYIPRKARRRMYHLALDVNLLCK